MKLVTTLITSIFFIGYLLIGLLYYSGIISHTFFIASIYAGILNLVNSLVAILLFNKVSEKSYNLFLLANLGGMIGRMFFILISVVVVIKFLNIDKYGFILVFFVYYFCLLLIEIWYFYNQSKNFRKDIKA